MLNVTTAIMTNDRWIGETNGLRRREWIDCGDGVWREYQNYHYRRCYDGNNTRWFGDTDVLRKWERTGRGGKQTS